MERRHHFDFRSTGSRGSRSCRELLQGTAAACSTASLQPCRSGARRTGQTIHAYAIRFINPKTFTGAEKRKGFRADLLRLYAFLVQEKPFRDPVTIRPCVAELFPRSSDASETGGYPDYFSPLTYWSSETLWKLIGVPFDVVTIAIELVARELRPLLEQNLRDLLPGTRPDSRWKAN